MLSEVLSSIIFLVIFFLLAGNTLEHFCLNVSIHVLQCGQPSSLVRRCRNTCFQKIQNPEDN